MFRLRERGGEGRGWKKRRRRKRRDKGGSVGRRIIDILFLLNKYSDYDIWL